MRIAAALCALLALSGCGSAGPLITVDQLLQQCDALKGKPVRLAGYLGDCGGLSCHLYADKAGWTAFAEAWYKVRDARETPSHDPKVSGALLDQMNAIPSIGIGGEAAFDRKVAPFQNSLVVITGTVASDTCTGEGGTDRSPGIIPTEIRAWTAAEGAPAGVGSKR